MDWLGKLDPNVIALLISAIGSLGAWVYHRAKGDKVDAFDDVIRGLGKQAIHELLANPDVAAKMSSANMQALAESLLLKLASSAKIPTDNAIVRSLITATAAHVVGDVQAELRKLDDAQKQLDDLAANVAAFPAQLAKTEADAFARGKKWADENVEVVPVEKTP